MSMNELDIRIDQIHLCNSENTSLLNSPVAKILEKQKKDNSYLDLANHLLEDLPKEIYFFPHLQHLYLEGNKIVKLPKDFFELFPHLEWLDLRHNCLKILDSNIGNHKCLQNLLLEGNNLENLPLELGKVKSLTGLNLRGNPLVFPPSDVIDQGVVVIKRFLYKEFMKRKNLKLEPESIKCSQVLLSNELPLLPSDESLKSQSDDHVIKTEKFSSKPELFQSFSICPLPLSKHDNQKRDFSEIFNKRMNLNNRVKKLYSKYQKNESERKRFVGIPAKPESNLKKVIKQKSFENKSLLRDCSQVVEDHEIISAKEKSRTSFHSDQQTLHQVRNEKDDEIRLRMKLYSRRLRRKKDEEKIEEKQNDDVECKTQEPEYRLKAFTADVESERPATKDKNLFYF